MTRLADPGMEPVVINAPVPLPKESPSTLRLAHYGALHRRRMGRSKCHAPTSLGPACCIREWRTRLPNVRRAWPAIDVCHSAGPYSSLSVGSRAASVDTP
jgi:hypothetical protein